MEHLDEAMRLTLGKAELPSLLEQVSEFSLDQVLKDGLLRDLPVVNWIVGTTKVGIAAREFFFLRKLIKFLGDLASVSPEDREKLIARLEKDRSFGKRAGEKITALLDRFDEEEKAVLASRAFKAFLNEKVTGMQLRRLLLAIDRMLLSDLPVLSRYQKSETQDLPGGDDPAIQSFIGGGLLHVRSGFGVGGVRPTETLGLFVEFVLPPKPDSNTEKGTD